MAAPLRYRSASACRLVGSVTTTKCQFWRFDPVGACCAIVRHSSSTARSTGRVKSKRFRTARVVVRTSSGSSVRWADIRYLLSGRAWADDGCTEAIHPLVSPAVAGHRPRYWVWFPLSTQWPSSVRVVWQQENGMGHPRASIDRSQLFFLDDQWRTA